MRKILILCIVAALASTLIAQEDGPKPSQASRNYAAYRHQDTLPSYGLAKVKAMVKKLKEDQDMNRRLPEKEFNALSFKEKFTFTMIHGEDFSQNCDMMPEIIDEQKKIFSFFPNAFDDMAMWSDRQREFLKKNRGEVINLIRETIKANKRVGNNLKNAILEIEGVELIPTVSDIYIKEGRKDHDILTLLALLMKSKNFSGFTRQPLYKQLYGSEHNYQAFVMATRPNQDQIIGVASTFYKNRNRTQRTGQ
jgi:hypothetical protein